MATINGIAVKGLKSFLGHEEETCYQGDVYIENKKVGFWSQNAWGGEDHFGFEKNYSRKKLSDRVIALNPDKAIHGTTYSGAPYTLHYDLELLMFDLVKLQNREKAFKKATNHDGFAGIMMLTDGYHEVMLGLEENLIQFSDEDVIKKLSAEIEDVKKDARFYKESDRTKHEFKIYRSLSDFKIGVPITLDEIKKEQVMDEKVKGGAKKVQKVAVKNKEKEYER